MPEEKVRAWTGLEAEVGGLMRVRGVVGNGFWSGADISRIAQLFPFCREEQLVTLLVKGDGVRLKVRWGGKPKNSHVKHTCISRTLSSRVLYDFIRYR